MLSTETPFLGTENVVDRDVTLGVIFLTQTAVGALGNLSLLGHYLSFHFTEHRVRTTDLILKHLILANCLTLLSKGVPHTMVVFGWKYFLSDIGCKIVLYLDRVAWGVSLSTTCLLSVFQAITIYPGSSRWSELKRNASRYINISIYLCWILQALVNIIFPMYVIASSNNRNKTDVKDYLFYSSVRHDETRDLIHGTLLAFPNVVCLGLTVWASGSMVIILHRHQQRVQYLQRSKVSSRSSPESRATKTILLLVSTFVFFYTLSSILHTILSILYQPTTLFLNISAIITLFFPFISPFLLMSRNSSMFGLCFARMMTKKT